MADSESMVIQYLAYTENNRSLSEYVIRSDWLEPCSQLCIVSVPVSIVTS